MPLWNVKAIDAAAMPAMVPAISTRRFSFVMMIPNGVWAGASPFGPAPRNPRPHIRPVTILRERPKGPVGQRPRLLLIVQNQTEGFFLTAQRDLGGNRGRSAVAAKVFPGAQGFIQC